MLALDHNMQALEQWRDGVLTRMRVSSLGGSRQLCIFEQFCDPGCGAPPHFHPVEEVLEVLEGAAEIQVGEETAIVTPNQSVVIPAGVTHAFLNLETSVLRIRATLAAPTFEATYR